MRKARLVLTVPMLVRAAVFDEIVADPKAQQVGVDVTPCS
jgi:hypothetical protein